MAESRPAWPVGFRYLALICASAVLLPVNRPVKGWVAASTFLTRAAAAFSQVLVSVMVLANWQAALVFLEPFGIAHAEPVSKLIGLPSRPRNGVPLNWSAEPFWASTFMIQDSHGKNPTWFFAIWLSLPKMSQVSRKDLNADQPPCSLMRLTA